MTLAVTQDFDDTALAEPDPSIHVQTLSPRGRRLRWGVAPALVRLARAARRADIVVSGSETGPGLLLGRLAARLARRPFVVLVHAVLEDAIEEWVPKSLAGPTRQACAGADAAICVSESAISSILRTGIPPDRVHSVHIGIDVAAVRARAGLPELHTALPDPDPVLEAASSAGNLTQPTVVGNGRLSVSKDFELLVRAHHRVLQAGVDHRLLIMGEGRERAAIEAVVEALGVESSVFLPGFVKEPYRHIAECDLFVLSSRTEGFSLALVEALALGSPIISTRCGAGVDLVLDGGRYGELVPVGDLDALAAAMERHLRNQGPLRERARSGPWHALKFDAGRAAADVLDILTRLVYERDTALR